MGQLLERRIALVLAERAGHQVAQAARALRPAHQVEGDRAQIVAAGDSVQAFVQLQAHEHAQVVLAGKGGQQGILNLFDLASGQLGLRFVWHGVIGVGC